MKLRVLLTCVAALVPVMALPSVAWAQPGTGTARITIAAPGDVPANVVLAGKTRHVAAKPRAGTSTVVTLTMPAGAYHVDLPRVSFGGTVYIGQSSRPEVVIRPGETFGLVVTYVAEEGSRGLHATTVGQTGLGLSWKAAEGSRFSLRRTTGAVPAGQRSDGVEIPTAGTTAVDKDLRPGTQYSYALFTQNKSRWYGPLTIVAGTSPAGGTAQASYIAAPSTLLLKPADIASVVTTGTGVRLVLQPQIATPLLGAGVVLPISDALPGGFLGVVTTLSSDGRTAGLTAGGLSDAFDYYELAVENISATSSQPVQSGLAVAAKTASVSCDSSGSKKITFSPEIKLAGHFKTKVDKYGFLGVDVPTGASVDMGFTITVTGAAALDLSGSVQCELKLPKLVRTFAVSPVPIAVSLSPTAQFSVSSGLKISNVGVQAVAGVQVTASATLKNGVSASGNTFMNLSPLAPVVEVNGAIGVKVGGEFLVGPGAATEKAGVIVGLGGEFNPVDASFKPHFEVSDARFNACTKIEVAFTRQLKLNIKAWLGDWDISKTVPLDALSGSTQYGGSPWFLPTGCKDLPASGTPDSLLGPGVVKVGDSVVGADGQWGHVDGFAPGTKTWVLSSGLIANAVGAPGQLASTNLGGDGDSGLTALAGLPTHDAATYEVKIVPAGTTLHVKYVFASEEYPEYVGSAFNDVMAVWVGGTNCATVPGTGEAVSINTVNDKKNSSFYVDNSTGASGYGTTMDGLTTPLTCSVPVTPGQPVTVRISVADTSDHILDSAVALLDGGIWTD
ncbi:choice-of-anchor L domain-containing protein [Lentzea sp. BCCO 10_0061]|uniref:Choice-of-anchor L domain-containing protein n=1 Tax=Lentzea sokolovensis TaxID=3095429 RepID=A0ABU4URA7_9PSEU|nr:choice-of-anchor L domain-containing protein [Lentzea sp. BCCO 10_0061]MDX8142031.1 choice-of-anchor L domain-containing protein [Lentzea sp. BCCO 10_0061]